MSIKKLDDGRYEVDIRPRGREGRRIRRKFDRKAEALAFERYTLANAQTKEWAGKRADRRTLSELLDVWWKYYGQNHERGTKEFNHLLKTIGDMGDMPVTRLSKRTLMDYRSKRLSEGVSASTINRDMYRLSGMFTKLIQLEEFAGVHPVHGLPPLAEANPEMAFLNKAEIALLLKSFTGDDLLVALLGISTGGRWSELATLKPAQIVNGRVTFLKTKKRKKSALYRFLLSLNR